MKNSTTRWNNHFPRATRLQWGDAATWEKRTDKNEQYEESGSVTLHLWNNPSQAADAEIFDALKVAIAKQGGICEVITPQEITGINLTDGSIAEGQQMLKGGASVLYDAVALIYGATGGKNGTN
jgi:hypothetical protein